MSALVGKQAVLACTVTNINNHSVGHQSPVTIYILWTIFLQCMESGMQPPDNQKDTALGAGFVLTVEWGHLQ